MGLSNLSRIITRPLLVTLPMKAVPAVGKVTIKAHDKKGDFEASEKLYQTALKKSPKSAELLCDLGYSHYLQAKWKESESNLKKALTLT